ncbi:penicillin-binding protein 2 [Chamaesiphon sp. VAR_69_metabat_338]|uniref:peptidoglycan D,D-transpeptidase FtsI family protein n=1 Tax=Chamaesiphon sp. VAR_69_metabat_338 TaxID=2964704 RepID=UPI00286DA1F4|nr:penicillin-binding protein 2 [Chamaesiphon sp. VAR_69_metabat_338]
MSNIRRNKSGQVGHNHRQQKVPSARTGSQDERETVAAQPSRSSPLQLGFRLACIWSVLGLGSLGLCSRLVWLQVVRASNLQRVAQQQQTISQRPFVPRRTIVDRSNNQLAIDRPSYTIYAHPSRFAEVKFGKGLPRNGLKVKIEPLDMAERIAPILGLPVTDLVARFQKRKTGVPIGNGIAEEIGNRLKALKLEGLDITQGEADYTRFYPQNDLVAEFLGYLDWEHKARSGVELSQSLLLERKVAQYQLTKSGGNKGSILPDRVTPAFLHTDDLKLRLTVDLRLQRATREALHQKMTEWHARRGTAIVMDADTGAIRALVVIPTYNPNQYAKDVEDYSKVVGRERASTLLQNAAVSDLYEPGSTFKPIAVAIALENQIIDRQTKLFDSGSIVVGRYTIRNSDKKGNGEIDISQILQHSSNVGMVKIMQRLKPDIYYDWLQRIGLGQKSGIDLPLEARGEVRSRHEFVASPIYPANTAFGQGFSLTPIQMVTLIGSIANGGKLVTPHVVEGLFDSGGVRMDKPNLPEPSQIFSPANTQAVLEMMEDVVAKGSGERAKIPGYRIAGKTGTSQKAVSGGYKEDDKKITSFVGILPVDGQHRYVVFAAIDEPKGKEKAFGSNVAAPIVKSIMESLISIEGIPPSDPSKIKPTTATPVPNVPD